METFGQLTRHAMLHKGVLYSNTQNDSCDILSPAHEASEKTAAQI